MGETVGSVSGHFRKVAISLHYLLNHEDFTDLTFVCSDGPVHCHKAMLLTHSPLLKYLFGISASHQASDTTVISLPQVEKITMIKLLQYVYKGKASFKKDQDLSKLYELAEVLDFDMSFAKKDPEDDGPRQTAVTSRTKKKKDANKKKQREEKEAAQEVQDEDLTSALIKKFQGQAQSPNKPDPVYTVPEESPTKKKKDATKTKQTEEKEAAKEVQDEDLSSTFIEKFQGKAQRQNKPAPVNPVLEESPTMKRKDDTKKKQMQEKEATKEVQDEDLSSTLIKKFQDQPQPQTKPALVNPVLEESPTIKRKDDTKKKQKEENEDLSSALIKKVQGQAQNQNKPAPVNTVLEESPNNKKKDANKKKQTEEKEAAKDVHDEDLSSALIKKFQGQAQSKNKPAPVNPVLEESPIIVAGKRKRVSQAVEEKKGKKYQYYTGNKVSRYQDGSDDGVATGQEEEENDSEGDSAVVNFIDVRSYEEGLAMDADVEECTKQRAAQDKMKIRLKNCGREKNVKEKVIEILEGDKSFQLKDAEEKDRHTYASVIRKVSNDPKFSLDEICNTSVVGNKENSDGKDNAPQVNMEINSNKQTSSRSKKQEQLNENVEGVGDKPLKENAKGITVKTNLDSSSSTRLVDLMDIGTSNEYRDLIEIDASNNKPNDDGNLNLKEETEKTKMPSNVEEQSKQKASLDNMKVNIFNCAKEEHIKEKVQALMNNMEEADSKQNNSELDSKEKRIGSKLTFGLKRKSKVKSYSEETSDESDHSEVEETLKKQGKKQIVIKAKHGDDASKTSDNKEKKKRFKRKKSTSSEEITNQSKMKTAAATDSNDVYKAISCYKCEIKCKTKRELRNHILTHFYPELCVFLPASKPFTCPTCSALSRDKTSLVRHYAFAHKEIYKYCTEEQLNGETVKGKQKSVYCQNSSNGFSQSPDSESWLSSANKNFNMTGDGSDDTGIFAVRKDVNYAVKSSDDQTKSVSNGGQEGSDPPENISEKFLGMDDNDPVDVDDLLQESDDGEITIVEHP